MTSVAPASPARADRGVSAVELAVVAPALLLVIFFMVQVALWLYGRDVAHQAASEGVSELRLVPAGVDVTAARSDVTAHVTRYAGRLGGSALSGPVVSTDYDDAAGRVTVTVTGQVVSLVPGLTLHVSQRASGEIERFEADVP
jgi:Flp pilus assembly protein TadG